jgi:hypothetical protein
MSGRTLVMSNVSHWNEMHWRSAPVPRTRLNAVT